MQVRQTIDEDVAEPPSTAGGAESPGTLCRSHGQGQGRRRAPNVGVVAETEGHCRCRAPEYY